MSAATRDSHPLRTSAFHGAPQACANDFSPIESEPEEGRQGLLRGSANRYGVSIRTDLAADFPKVTADRVQIQQVLMNLMLNAIEAMKETGGVLTVKSQPGEAGPVMISVSDTGMGLPADKSDEIFKAFVTTKPQGRGMGLAISRLVTSFLQIHNNSRAQQSTLNCRFDSEVLYETP